MVNKKGHEKPTMSVMMWGAIWKGGRSDLVVMERDQESKRKGFTTKSYLKTLEKALLPYYDGTRDFQQDNAPIHKSHTAMKWFVNNMIELMDWPAHSPDLAPIEHIWAKLKRAMDKLDPTLWEKTKNAANLVYFTSIAKKAWWGIPQADIDVLIDSMPNRLRAVLAAKGGYTKY